ncbi:MAG: DUF4348 domain-containing protein [Alloprevotella sp.]
MRHSLLLFILLMTIPLACRQSKPEEPAKTQPDTLAADTAADTTAVSEPEPPAVADGLFDDFIYNFMRNRKFQQERIKFPLEVAVDGTVKHVRPEEWTFDRLYARKEYYTMIFADERSVGCEKDTSLSHVVVEWVYLRQKRVKEYDFLKHRGQWRLEKIVEHAFHHNANADFYDFLNRFVNDEAYQQAHIAETFHFKTYDYDNFQEIEGTVTADQWPDYRPELPQGVITNINYGQSYENTHTRVLVLSSMSGGMSCTLTFKKIKGMWLLTSLDN